MIARLVISSSLEDLKKEIQQTLASHIGSGNTDHPDILYFSSDSKLGIEQARKIKEHFSLKPYSAKGRAVVLENASSLTHEAQNALLKVLEELPPHALFILATDSDSKLLPTVVSRCEIVILEATKLPIESEDAIVSFHRDIEKLLQYSIEERFEYIEKLKDREEFLYALVFYFRNQLFHLSYGRSINETNNFLKELLQAEEWAKQNVNIRAILEYLMLVMPQKL